MDEDRRWSTLPDGGRRVEGYEIGNRARKKAGWWVIGIV